VSLFYSSICLKVICWRLRGIFWWRKFYWIELMNYWRLLNNLYCDSSGLEWILEINCPPFFKFSQIKSVLCYLVLKSEEKGKLISFSSNGFWLHFNVERVYGFFLEYCVSMNSIFNWTLSVFSLLLVWM
jgi:hypothetical protein